MAIRRFPSLQSQLLDAVGQAVIATDLDGIILFWNQAARALYGWKSEEVLGRSVLEVTPSEEMAASAASIMETVLRGGTWEGTFQVRDRHGRSFTAHVTDSPIRDDEGNVVGVIGTSRDVTEHVQSWELREKHSRQLTHLMHVANVVNSEPSLERVLRIVVDESRDVIGAHQGAISITASGGIAQRITAISLSEKYDGYRAFETPPDGSGIYRLVAERNETLRLTQEELEAHPAWRGFGREASRHPPMRGWLAVPIRGRAGENLGILQLSDKHDGEFTEDDEAILAQLAAMAATAIHTHQLLEATQRHALDLERRVAERTRELTVVNEELTREVRDRAAAQRALQESEQRWRGLVETNPDPVFITVDERIVYVNRACQELVGASSPEELVGRSPFEFLEGRYRRIAEERRADALRGAISRPQEYELTRFDGGVRHIESFSVPISYVGRTAIQTVARDVSDRKTTERQLERARHSLTAAREAERAHVARELHDGVLQHILGLSFHTDSLRRVSQRMGDEGTGRALGSGLVELHDQLLDGVRQLRRLIRGLRPVGLEDLGVGAALHEYVTYLREEHRGVLPDVRLTVEDELRDVPDRVALCIYRSGQELLRNAVRHAQASWVEVRLGRTEEGVSLCVRDDGSGFEPPHNLAALAMENHFGLLGVKEHVASVAGSVVVESEVGNGTAVFIRIPLPQ